MKGSCIECRYWEPDGDEGICHRHAPHPLVLSIELIQDMPPRYFPSTCGGDWCGDFQPRVQEVVQ